MATDPDEIRLNDFYRKWIAERADSEGRDWKEVVDDLFTISRMGLNWEQLDWLMAQEQAMTKIWDNADDSIYDDLPKGPRKPGSAKGKIWISDDFDEPLDEFKEYMK